MWYRVTQIVINRDDIQAYAAKTVFEVSIISFLLGKLSKISYLPIEPIDEFRCSHLGRYVCCGPPFLSHLSIIELAFVVVYPETGGLSGIVSRKFPRSVLNAGRSFVFL